MRLFRVTDTNEAASLAQQCRLELSNKQKFELQTVYFNKERENIAGAESVRSLLQEIFRGLGVPEEDAQIILDGFPTMQQLVRATEEELAENSPASMNSIRAIAAFFQGH